MTPPSAPPPASPLPGLPPAEAAQIDLGADVTPDDLARYAVALANTRGGVIRVGAGQGSAELHPLQVTHAIFALSGGRLSVNVVRAQGEAALSIFVPQAPYLLSAPDGSVSGWDGHAFVPVSPADAPVSAQQDYTASVPVTASLADLDPLEVARLRSISHRGALSQLADLDFLRELGLISEVQTAAGTELRPNIAGLLLAGTERALRAHIPQAEVCYYHHATSDVEFQFREDLLRPITAALTRLSELIQARNSFTPVQVGLFRIEVWDHDEAVYREALLNALTHRDYQLRDVVHVHHYPDRLEIMNPGGLPGNITAENILRHQPKRRNPLLAEALARLGLVERAGVGVDKMYAMMLRCGKEPPEYLTYPDAVSLSLHNPGFDARFVRFVARKQEEMQTLSLDMLIVLSLLGREGEASRAQLARALQLPEDRTPRLLGMMEERGLIVSERVGRERINRLSAQSLAALRGRDAAPTAPSPGARRPRPQDQAAQVALQLAARPEGVRNSDLRAACDLSTQAAWRVLRRLTLSGQLRKLGQGPRSVRYQLPEG
ncbi:ATP-dependent DNA helicase RecG [Deinococcus irradiatisoli]|uniref:ATP-dependent DNA helicase RecG n=1 Tax=Deinococcus irradiatisoli TaxID=2202254 RepID=A0A2Z3JLZ9_9DEIO|nr:ATP-binding protein [Deinococcus irradiatisoli]AWN23849.1 ATP-dependent DNA helicase RecG [Deinococcus irradiatisoli]